MKIRVSEIQKILEFFARKKPFVSDIIFGS